MDLNIMLVDDEEWSLNDFKAESAEIDGYKDTVLFQNSIKALEYAKNKTVDFAILDIEMPHMNGIELAEQLKKINPNMVIIFLTAYEKYLPESIRINADYYILKPYESENLQKILDRAGRLSKKSTEQKIEVRTFGQFDVFVNDICLAFNGKKVKELFALLVDKRGGVLRTEEAFYRLYEEKEYTNTNAAAYHKLARRLQTYLELHNLGHLISTENGLRKLNCQYLQCDYWDFLDGKESAIIKFHGSYMTDYWWSEDTIGDLVEFKEKYFAKK